MNLLWPSVTVGSLVFLFAFLESARFSALRGMLPKFGMVIANLGVADRGSLFRDLERPPA